ncbi:hypothetical protein IWQ61_006746 [Dispira simplex]|nr:hypothetical protein IWQ61_006746 [Dispira simplex]
MSQSYHSSGSWATGGTLSTVKGGGADSPCEPKIVETNNLDTHFRNTRRVRYISSGMDSLLSAAEYLPSLSGDLLPQPAPSSYHLPPPVSTEGVVVLSQGGDLSTRSSEAQYVSTSAVTAPSNHGSSHPSGQSTTRISVSSLLVDSDTAADLSPISWSSPPSPSAEIFTLPRCKRLLSEDGHDAFTSSRVGGTLPPLKQPCLHSTTSASSRTDTLESLGGEGCQDNSNGAGTRYAPSSPPSAPKLTPPSSGEVPSASFPYGSIDIHHLSSQLKVYKSSPHIGHSYGGKSETHSPSGNPPPPSSAPTMITITCLHALVAQKSYGSEKRFLCPPPMIMLRGTRKGVPVPLSAQDLPFTSELSMTVVNDRGADTHVQSTIALDSSGVGICKHLHVSNMAKSKFFKLRLDLPKRDRHVDPSRSSQYAAIASSLPSAVQSLPFATFESSPISIISKPSKKTAKARNNSSCVLSGSSIALFNRINSQTVRTKFLSVHDGVLCARNATWAAFTITLASSNHGVMSGSHDAEHTGMPITYGSEVILSNASLGIRTEPMVICKVEKGRLAASARGPVSQMQKIAFQRTRKHPTSPPSSTLPANYYLSSVTNAESDPAHSLQSPPATEFTTAVPPMPSPFTTPNSPGTASTHFSAANGGDSSPSLTDAVYPGSATTAGHGVQQAPLEFLPSQIVPCSHQNHYPTAMCPSVEAEEIHDKLCWTVVGITRFDYSFMETEGPSWFPITPFPHLSVAPIYRSVNHTLELRISNPPLDPKQMNSDPGQPPFLRLRLGPFGLMSTRITSIAFTPNQRVAITSETITQRVGYTPPLPSSPPTSTLAEGPQASNGSASPTSSSNKSAACNSSVAILMSSLPSVEMVFQSNTTATPSSTLVQLPIQLCRLDGVVFDTGYDLVYDNSEVSLPNDWPGSDKWDYSRLQVRVVARC